MKKSRKLLLLLALVCTLLVCCVMSASALVFSGTAGTNVKWTYDTSTKVLEFTGSGKMTDYGVLIPTPWTVHKQGVKKIVIGNGITHIGSNAFETCAAETVVIPDSVASIGHDAFRTCTKLKSVVIPEKVTVIEQSTFEACDSLSKITFSSNLKKIDNRAFYSCDSLTSVFLPDSVEEIGSEAFNWCTNLQKVYLGNSVKTIGGSAFSFTVIENLFLPASIEKVANSSFSNNNHRISILVIEKGAGTISAGDISVYEKPSMVYFTGTEAEWKSAGHMKNYTGTVKYSHTHTFNSYVGVVKEATCVSGIAIYGCSVCKGAMETRVISPSKSHSYTYRTYAYSDKYPTCITTGSYEYKCDSCGTKTNKTIKINPNNHIGTYNILVQATCTEPGSQHLDCPCGYSNTETIDALGHNYSGTTTEATCESDSVFNGTCTRCGDKVSEVKQEALGHSFDVSTHKCKRCDKHVSDVCSHMCHKNNGKGTGWYRFCLFFWRLFRMNKVCSCGLAHY